VKLVDTARKKEGILKVEIDEFKTNRKIINITVVYRGINNFRKSYQPITNIYQRKRRVI